MCREWNFLSQKRGGGGRGVKEKQQGSTNDTTSVTGVMPYAADVPVLSSSGGHTVEKVMAGHDENDGKVKRVAYPVVPNYVRNTWGKYGLAKSMLNSSTGLFLFQFSSMDGLNSMLENGSWFIRNNLLILKKWNLDVNLLKEDVVNVPFGLNFMVSLSSYARAMIELRADVELKDAIVVAMFKLIGEGFYMCTVRVEYEWKPPRGVPVGPKVRFKPVKQVYRQVSKKNNVNTSGNNKKNVEVRKEVSNLNPFDVLNSVENDVDFGTNEGTSNLASKEASSSGSSFWNVESSSISTTPIVEKIDKLDKLIINGKITRVDDEGKPLKKVDHPGDHDSEDEVAPVYNKMTSFLASEMVG
ncbi:reverse transcriptase domain-containing protein [Tanacetum coccineum]